MTTIDAYRHKITVVVDGVERSFFGYNVVESSERIEWTASPAGSGKVVLVLKSGYALIERV